MSDLPIVSVVIPCLNRAHLLVPTIESVLQQDYPHIECIVVDAGSTDGTVEVLKSYGDRIKWVSEPDGGHADAINKGWRMSTGEILAWLNADDVWEIPRAVSRAVEYLRANPEVDVVYGDCGDMDLDGNVVGMSYLHKWDLEYAVEYCDHCIPQPAAFLRRRIVEKVGYLDRDFNDSKKDHELWLRIGLVGTIHYLPVLFAHARNGPGYMASRGDITARACVRLTRKFFTLPDVPERIRKKKRRAISNAYLKGLDYAFSDGGHWSTMVACALRAITSDPTNTHRAVGRLKYYLEISAPENARFRLLLVAYILLNAPRRAWIESRAMIANLFRRPEVKQVGPARQNLLGDRDIEYSWIASQIPCGTGEALDFGSGGSHLGLMAAQSGFDVTEVDMAQISWPYLHPRLRFLRGDILTVELPPQKFDLILNCSTVEHVGIVGRYDVTDSRSDGDLEAMARLRALMKPGATMLLTIPIGRDAVFAPLCRVYGAERLPRLLEGYIVEKEEFWVKDEQNRWVQNTKETALNFEAHAGSWDPMQNVTALGCFVLRKH